MSIRHAKTEKIKKHLPRISRRSFGLIISVLFMAAGLILIFYPSVSDLIARYAQSAAVAKYENTVQDTNTEARMCEAEAYNQSLAEEKAVDNDATGLTDEYDVIAAITISKISVSLPVYLTSSDENLARGAVHMKGTSLPVGGTNTNAVIAGHRGLSGARLFTDLNKMEKGDLFYIRVLGETHAYKVCEICVTEPEDDTKLKIQEGKDLVTLYTCTPIGINSRRLLVIGERTADPAVSTEDTDTTAVLSAILPLTVILIIAAIVTIILAAGYRKRKKEE